MLIRRADPRKTRRRRPRPALRQTIAFTPALRDRAGGTANPTAKSPG
jgi:hypothetical protein